MRVTPAPDRRSRALAYGGPEHGPYTGRVLVGRDAERARLRALLTDAREGRSAVLVVSGEPGVGKTALLDDAAEGADGMRVVRAVGIESETTMPFGALFDVCRPFLGSIGELPERQRQALEGALAMGPAAEGDLFAIGAATLSLLAADARDAPLLLVIDDAQWLDSASAASLAFALRRLDADAVAVLIGLRSGEAGGFDATGYAVLEPGRLSAADAVALARSRRPVTPEQAERIARASGGNPLAVLELAGSETSGVDGLVPIPAHIEHAFAARAEHLPETTQDALLIAAVDDLGLLDVLDRATSLEALGAAEDAGLVRIAQARLEFRHPLVRSAIYQRASPTERRVAHAALADALPAEQTTRRAWHRAAAIVAPDAGVADALEAVAAEAEDRHGAAAAAAAWLRAAELTPDQGVRARRLLAGKRRRRGRPGASDAAHQAADAALAACTDPLMHADIVRVRARIDSHAAGLPRRSRRRCEPRPRRSPRSTRRGPHTSSPTRASRSGRRGTPSRTSSSRGPRARRPAMRRPAVRLHPRVGALAAGSTAEAAHADRRAPSARSSITRSGDPTRARSCCAADCAWWRSGRAVVRARAPRRSSGPASSGWPESLRRRCVELADGQIRHRRVGRRRDAAGRGDPAGRGHRPADERRDRRSAAGPRSRRGAGDAERFEELTAAAARTRARPRRCRRYERNSRCLLALGAGDAERAIAAREQTERYSIEQLSANALDLIEAYIRAGRLDDARARLDEVDAHVHLDQARRRVRPLPCAHGRRPTSFEALFEESVRLFTGWATPSRSPARGSASASGCAAPTAAVDARRELGAALDTFEQLRAGSVGRPRPPRAPRERRAPPRPNAGGTRRPHPAGAPDRSPRRRGAHEPRDRCAALPQPAHDRDASWPGVPKARNQRPKCAPGDDPADP